MKRMLALVVAMAAIAILGDSNVQAQNYVGGYEFGAGIQSYSGGNFARGYTPREQPPYFAQYPPVYYSHVVKRPYGVSPYAAPAGIMPVEMAIPVPMNVMNPFFQPEVESVSEEVESSQPLDNKTTQQAPVRISNPHASGMTAVASIVK